MVNAKHVEVAKHGPIAIAAWRRENPDDQLDLRHASLHSADFRHADLVRSDLSGANLDSASLERANLRGANLSGADLRRTDLYKATFCAADLRGADLRDSIGLSQEQVDSADGDSTTRLPDGLFVPEHWEIVEPKDKQ